MKDFYTTKEVAVELGVTDAYVRQMILSGKIVAEKAGRDHFISAMELEKARRRRTKRGPEPRGDFQPTKAAKKAPAKKRAKGKE